MKSSTLKILEESGLSEEEIIMLVQSEAGMSDNIGLCTPEGVQDDIRDSANEKHKKVINFVKKLFSKREDRVIRVNKKIDGFNVSINSSFNFAWIDLWDNSVSIPGYDYACDIIWESISIDIPENSSQITQTLFNHIDEYILNEEIIREHKEELIDMINNVNQTKANKIMKFVKSLNFSEEEIEYIHDIEVDLRN